MRPTPTILRAGVPALLLSLVPGALAGQTALRFDMATPATAATTRAVEVHDRAESLSENLHTLAPVHLRRVAAMHLRAARLFDATDPRGVDCLEHAANLLSRHAPQRAARLQQKAADRALAYGDVRRAAHGYVSAAAFLQQQIAAGTLDGSRWARPARGFVARAELLADSPELTREQSDAILKRIR